MDNQMDRLTSYTDFVSEKHRIQVANQLHLLLGHKNLPNKPVLGFSFRMWKFYPTSNKDTAVTFRRTIFGCQKWIHQIHIGKKIWCAISESGRGGKSFRVTRLLRHEYEPGLQDLIEQALNVSDPGSRIRFVVSKRGDFLGLWCKGDTNEFVLTMAEHPQLRNPVELKASIE